MRPSISLNLHHLLRHPVRVALSAAGIAAGVALAIGVDGLAASIRGSIQATTRAAATRADLEVRPVTQVPMPEGFLAAARALEDVAAAAGTVEARTRLRTDGATVQVFMVGFEPGLLALAPGAIPPGSLEGTDPSGLLMPAPMASSLGVSRGDEVLVYTPRGWRPVRVGGVLPPGAAGSAPVVAAGLLTAQDLLGRQGRLDALYVQSAAGPGRAAAALAGALGSGVQVGPPAMRTEDVRQMTASVDVLLNVAALVSLFVGGFLVYNTMTMAAVERAGEAAVLRAVGATRSQVVRVFAVEGLMLGIAGALAGMAGGSVLARALLSSRGRGLSAILPIDIIGFTLSPGRIAAAGAGGVVVAVLAALAPARHVARADAAANLGPAAVLEEPAGPPPWRRLAAGLVGLGGGGAIMAFWARGAQESLTLPLAGMALFLTGVASLIRPAVPLLARGLLAFLARRRKVPPALELAAGEIAAAPGRTSFTVGALVLALALVIGLEIDLASFRTAFDRGLSRLIRADVMVRSQDWQPYGSGVGIDPGVAAEIRGLPGVAAAYPSRTLLTTHEGKLSPVIAVAEEGYRLYAELESIPPADRELNRRMVGGGKVLVSVSASERFGLAPGERVALKAPAGPRSFEVAGVYDDPSAVLPTFYMTFEDAAGAWQVATADVIDVFVAPGASPAGVIGSIEERLGAAYGVQAQTRRAFIDGLNGILASLNRLLSSVQLVAVVVAGLGVANTLLMSTVARRRDLGVLRAVGMLRGQLRRMVAYEALIIGGLGVGMSWIVGTGIGLFAHRITRIQTGVEMPLIVPPALFVAVLALGVAAALAGAVYPARRAAAQPVVESLQYE